MRWVLTLVAAVVLVFEAQQPVEAYHCLNQIPEGKGEIPVEFTLDGVPRAQVRFRLLGTSAQDVITGPDGRAVFTHIPYGCYTVEAQWRDNEWFRSHSQPSFILLPNSLQTWAGVKIDRVRLVAQSSPANSWFNPESYNGPRATALPDCATGPWPDGYGLLPVETYFRNGRPANQVRVSLVNASYPDQITGGAGLGRVYFGVPYGCYTLRFEYGLKSGGLESTLYYPVTVLPEGLYSGDYLVPEIDFQIPN